MSPEATKNLPIDPQDMAKAYDPRSFEVPIYDWWESNGFFKPEIAGPAAKPFVIAIPPPNVTGELHLGHAMFVALEDLMIRYQRMRGRAALWVPGTDHAGIATQLQVERMLINEGTSREEVGREEFLRRTWEWKAKYGGHIVRQLRRLGASCDWERERFTMDEGLSRAVREAFVRLYEKGLIYRGEYLVNWSPGLQTAVSDLEVEYSEEEGKLYYFKYPIAGTQDFIAVATTRPETVLGDTAVAVHPDDERYRHLIGKTCLVPILNRTIPIIHDTYVDMKFGTGAVKITPGHDPNDFVIGQRHGLQVINVLNKDATMNANAGPYEGLDRFECRQKLWADMEAAGLTVKVKPHKMQVPRSQRGGEIVEPMVSAQWFVKMESLAAAGLKAVHNGDIKIIPERFAKIYDHWLENIRDWCISRQLWWGHRIPVWYCEQCEEMIVARQDPTTCPKCGSSNLKQDPDVLDTWFSSGLWPFSTLGWPEKTPDLQRYYPTHVMETGYDILFFWVARMVMLGLEFTGQPPFHTIYLHGLVRDEKGRKMSKTTGNVVDPIQVMDEYGTDALRFTLLTGSTPGSDMNLSLERVAGNRNFSNKIWNATRFVVNNMGTVVEESGAATWNMTGLTIPDRWILSRLNQLIREVTRLMDEYNYGEAGRQLYDFFWSEFADWYIEMAKIRLQDADTRAQITVRRVLGHVLDRSLRMLHPFIPFVTEAAWQHLPHGYESLMVAPWPQPTHVGIDAEAETHMDLLMEAIRTIRNIRSEYNVEPGKRIIAYVAGAKYTEMLNNQQEILVSLARLDSNQLIITSTLAKKPAQAVSQVISGGIEIYLPLAGMIDLSAEKERLAKELAQLEKFITASEGKLRNPSFVEKAPADVVQRERDRLENLKVQAEKTKKQIEDID